MTRQQRKDGSRDAAYAFRYDREALAVACAQCSVPCGAVECEASIADGYVPAERMENGVTILRSVPAQWVMTNNPGALVYRGA